MWQDKNNRLYKKFEFKDFNEAFSFMNEVARFAEQINHHPKWQNEWNKVEIWLTTHQAGNKVTNKDRELAYKIDKIYKEFNE
jgi:4a-hydroxytetrahydrobiopterin dehydratase